MENQKPYGRALIELLLPHRSPFLMVGSVTSYQGGPKPSLTASLTSNDNDHHFPVKPGSYWPSVYIIEGLGQCCNLMIFISILELELTKSGQHKSIYEVLTGLIHDDCTEVTLSLKAILEQRQAEAYSTVGLMGSSDIEITGRASYNQLISYEVQQNQSYGSLYHSNVKAFADSILIASGTMVSAARY